MAPATKRTTAKAEAGKAAPSVLIKGKKFKLPKKLSHRLLRAVESGSIIELVNILFGDQSEEYWELDLSIEESTEQIGKIVEKLGLSLGE